MAQLQKGTTYITGDQVTAANLNALVDSGILTPGAVTDQTAKTVPLAADTILLHSAADTALRKTTMTQLFATPQPLGATTPSSVAATTGTFSSTLGVTGVATLGNGAILGTPASGTVTNLTGTASININGTVGATTAAAGSFTTLAASGAFTNTQARTKASLTSSTGTNDVTISLTNTGGRLDLGRENSAGTEFGLPAYSSALYSGGAYDLYLGANGVPTAVKITSTGLNSTAIGATTPSTGAFSTLSASSTGLVTGTFGVGAAPVSEKMRVQAAAGYNFVVDTNSSSLRISAVNDADSSNVPFIIQGSTVTFVGSTAVTGTLSATDAISTAATGAALTLNSGDAATDTYMLLKRGSGTSWAIAHDSQGGLSFAKNLTDKAYFGRSGVDGLTVTGILSCTGALSKGSGSFRIEHPLPSKSATHQLVHSFIEGPKCDLIYRGKIDLVDGKASVNIDADSTMTEGTFEALCTTVQCFTSNESGWGAIRGKVVGNILTIEAQDAASTDNVSWMVIGERKDPHIMDTDWTDENGRPIVEPLKPAEPALESK